MVSATVHGPSYMGGTTNKESTEFRATAHINFQNSVDHEGPIKMCAPGAGRLGKLRWYWSNSGSNYVWEMYTDNTDIMYAAFESSDNDFLKDSYMDVAIQGYGRCTSFPSSIDEGRYKPKILKPNAPIKPVPVKPTWEEEFINAELL